MVGKVQCHILTEQTEIEQFKIKIYISSGIRTHATIGESAR